jgi:diphthine synthase
MGKLIFIGLGLADEKGLTVKGLEAAKASEIVFMETYTSTLSEGSVNRLEKLIGKDISLVSRETVEGGDRILGNSQNQTVSLLVPGDPMSATTHVDLRLRAEEMGTETLVIPGVSSLTAVPALLGLQIYKFGQTVTIPIPEPNFRPTSFYEKALENLNAGLHTLCLLDIKGDEERYMTANEGFEELAFAEKELGKGLITGDRIVCVVARAGADDALAKAGFFKEMSEQDFGQPLHSIVIPGKLHFLEAQALVKLAGAPEEILQG